MVMQKANHLKDKIIERNGKIYIFFHRSNGRYDDKPEVYNNWEDAGQAYNIFNY